MCAAVREAAMWLCNCKAGGDVAYIAVREVIWPVQLWGMLQHGHIGGRGVATYAAIREAVTWPCSCEAYSNAVYAAARGATWPIEWQGMQQLGMCSCDGGWQCV
jgi:hypothetical protein